MSVPEIDITFPDNAVLRAASGNLRVVVNGQVQDLTGGGGGGTVYPITTDGSVTTLQQFDGDTSLAIVTADSDTGNSGDIEIKTGQADGTRGHVIIDADEVSAPSGFQIDAGANPISLTVSEPSADNGNGADVVVTAGPGGTTSGN